MANPVTLEDLQRPTRSYLSPDARQMVPSFYDPHPDNGKGIVVTHEGAPVLSECGGKPFTVEEVPLWRRWAIQPNGEVVTDSEFARRHTLWHHEFYAELTRGKDIRNDPGQPEHEYRPNPVAYVSVMADPMDERNVVPMHYDAHQTEGARPKAYATQEGEEVERPRLEVLQEAYASQETRALMRPDEIAEVEAARGGVVAVSSESVMEKVAALERLRDAGIYDATEFKSRVDHLLGVGSPEGTADASGHKGAARCGKEFDKGSPAKLAAAIRMHERSAHCCKGGA